MISWVEADNPLRTLLYASGSSPSFGIQKLLMARCNGVLASSRLSSMLPGTRVLLNLSGQYSMKYLLASYILCS